MHMHYKNTAPAHKLGKNRTKGDRKRQKVPRDTRRYPRKLTHDFSIKAAEFRRFLRCQSNHQQCWWHQKALAMSKKRILLRL